MGEILEKLILKIKKDPCKKCLIKMVCQKTCKDKYKYVEFSEKVSKKLFDIDWFITKMFAISIVVFIVFTFIFGFYTWFLIFKNFYG